MSVLILLQLLGKGQEEEWAEQPVVEVLVAISWPTIEGRHTSSLVPQRPTTHKLLTLDIRDLGFRVNSRAALEIERGEVERVLALGSMSAGVGGQEVWCARDGMEHESLVMDGSSVMPLPSKPACTTAPWL